MPFIIPVIAFAVCLFIGLIATAVYFSPKSELPDKPSGKTVIGLNVAAISLGIWLSLFGFCDLREKETKIVNVQYLIEEKGKIAAINYLKNNKMVVVNLNINFGMQIAEGSKIKVTQYETGTYYGLSYMDLNDKLEILEK